MDGGSSPLALCDSKTFFIDGRRNESRSDRAEVGGRKRVVEHIKGEGGGS